MVAGRGATYFTEPLIKPFTETTQVLCPKGTIDGINWHQQGLVYYQAAHVTGIPRKGLLLVFLFLQFSYISFFCSCFVYVIKFYNKSTNSVLLENCSEFVCFHTQQAAETVYLTCIHIDYSSCFQHEGLCYFN